MEERCILFLNINNLGEKIKEILPQSTDIKPEWNNYYLNRQEKIKLIFIG